MTPRYLIPSLATVLALTVVVPAFGGTPDQGGRHLETGGTTAPHNQGHRGDTSGTQPSRHRTVEGDGLATASAPALDAADVATLTDTGSFDLPVTVTGAASISVVGESAVGSATTTATGTAPDGSTQKVQVPKDYAQVFVPTSRVAAEAGTINVPVELTAAGKAAMDRGERVQLLLVVDSPGPGPTIDMFVPMAG